jgi:hypothetical protein
MEFDVSQDEDREHTLKKVGQIENSLIMVDAFGRGFAFEF